MHTLYSSEFPPSTTMGNHITSNRRSSPPTGKVILSNGTVHEYDAPLTVAELMLEYPQQVVVEFRSATAGKRPSPLPADEKLERHKLYVMLPMRKGKPASLTSVESRELLIRANNVLKSPNFFASTTGFLPFFVKICPVGNDYVVQKKEEVEYLPEKEDVFGKLVEETPEFMSGQLSGKGWKPSLDTIKEKVIKPKVRHWLY